MNLNTLLNQTKPEQKDFADFWGGRNSETGPKLQPSSQKSSPELSVCVAAERREIKG